MSKLKENKHLSQYKLISSPDWIYKSPDGTYATEFVIIEDQIIYENAFGKPSLEDTKCAIKIILTIIDTYFPHNKPHLVSDARKIKGADADVRKYIAEFHKNHAVFETVSLIAGVVTKALFSVAKNLGVGNLKNWKVYGNEKYCIDEVLKGEVIIGQSGHQNEYELIYKALADISNNKFSYKRLFNESGSNEELTSVIKAIQIINEENKLSDVQLDVNHQDDDTDIQSSKILFKSILENTETIVALMTDDFSIVHSNKNFNNYFNTEKTKLKSIHQFIDIEDAYVLHIQEKKYTHFITTQGAKTLACKLYKIDNLDNQTYTIFIGEDITEKESLKASEKKLLNELKDQNFKLLKVNHLLSHEINHQIASLSQILEEFRGSVSSDEHLEEMIHKIKNDLNVSLDRVNSTLFDTESLKLQNVVGDLNVYETEKLKVLLVDDDNITNFFNERIIKKTFPDFEIDVKTDAAEALDVVKRGAYLPDIIFLDLNMPTFSGFDFLKNLNKLKLDKAPVIYVLSSSQDPDEMQRANAYREVVGYHAKPLTKDKVKGVVSAFQLIHEKPMLN